jgi:serine/threonine protein kinase
VTEPRSPSADDWQRINRLFHAALAERPADRAAFVERATADDARVRAEVLSLLAAHDRAAQFLEGGDAPTIGAGDPAALIGRQIGHYRVERVLGEGGMGVVYLAEDTRLGRTVALKAVAPKFTGDATRRDRLKREARAAAALTHPGIATVFALEEIDDQIFIAGEYVPGETLRDELGRGPLNALRAVDTALGIARALAAAHDRGIIHRDLKPENVIRAPGGDVKVLDFGLARFRDLPAELAHLTDDGTLLGTPAYMSPEQIRSGTVDGRSDLFALGIVFYEMVAGRHPFAGSDPASTIARILEGEPPRLTTISAATAWNPAVLGELETLVLTCLRKAPDARYRSVHEFVRVLERARERMVTGAGSSPVTHLSGSVTPAGTPLYWWQVHQAVTSGVYAGALVPLWYARGAMSAGAGRYLFLAGFVAVLTSVTLRLHSWFTLRSDPAEWSTQLARERWWIAIADVVIIMTLLAAGIVNYERSEALGATLIALAVAILISVAVIEPATTRAATRQ